MTGAGRVFRRGKRWWLAYYTDGAEQRESCGPDCQSEREARRRLAPRIAEVQRGEWQPRRAASPSARWWGSG